MTTAKALTRFVRRRLRPAVVWAMVPLAALMASPVSGCICADGHYEQFCRAYVGRTAEGGANHGPRGTGCASSCCQADEGSACCLERGRLADSHNQSVVNGSVCERSVCGSGCCTPVVQAQLIAPVATAPQLGDDLDVPAPFAAPVEPARAYSLIASGQFVEDDTGPPPGDIVVTLRRLII